MKQQLSNVLHKIKLIGAQYQSWLLGIIVTAGVIALCIFMLQVYGGRYAHGAFGDDSPGYIFVAAQFFHGHPIIWQDALGKQALDFFGDYRFADWILPSHHEFINPNGTIASKYPIAASLVLAAGAFITGSIQEMYIVMPLMGAGIVLLTGFLVIQLLGHFPREKWVVGLVSATLVATSPIYITTVVSQPMRELPSMFFLLLASTVFFAALLPGVRQKEHIQWSWQRLVMIALSGLFFGIACSVRETSVMILPAFIFAGSMLIAPQWKAYTGKRMEIFWAWLKELFYRAWKPVVMFIITCAIGLLPIITNSARISTLHESFKSRDTEGVVLLSNINHLESVQLKNIFVSEGRYRPAQGSLQQYYFVIQDFSPVPWLLVPAIIGLVALLRGRSKKEKAFGVFLATWIFGTLTIFSLWVNPYSRYVLPILPPFMVLVGIGFMVCINAIRTKISGYVAAVVVIFGLCTLVNIALVTHTNQYRFIKAGIEEQRAMSTKDASTLASIASDIRAEHAEGDAAKRTPLVLFAGKSFENGASEVFWAHTDVRGVRYPIGDDIPSSGREKFELFIDQIQEQGTDVYVLTSVNLTSDLAATLKAHHAEEKRTDSFSFVQNTKLWMLH